MVRVRDGGVKWVGWGDKEGYPGQFQLPDSPSQMYSVITAGLARQMDSVIMVELPCHKWTDLFRLACRRWTRLLRPDSPVTDGLGYYSRTRLSQMDSVITAGLACHRWTQFLRPDLPVADGLSYYVL